MGIYTEVEPRHYEVFPYPDWLKQDSWIIMLRDRPIKIVRDHPGNVCPNPVCMIEFKDEYIADNEEIAKGFADFENRMRK